MITVLKLTEQAVERSDASLDIHHATVAGSIGNAIVVVDARVVVDRAVVVGAAVVVVVFTVVVATASVVGAEVLAAAPVVFAAVFVSLVHAANAINVSGITISRVIRSTVRPACV